MWFSQLRSERVLSYPTNSWRWSIFTRILSRIPRKIVSYQVPLAFRQKCELTRPRMLTRDAFVPSLSVFAVGLFRSCSALIHGGGWWCSFIFVSLAMADTRYCSILEATQSCPSRLWLQGDAVRNECKGLHVMLAGSRSFIGVLPRSTILSCPYCQQQPNTFVFAPPVTWQPPTAARVGASAGGVCYYRLYLAPRGIYALCHCAFGRYPWASSHRGAGVRRKCRRRVVCVLPAFHHHVDIHRVSSMKPTHTQKHVCHVEIPSRIHPVLCFPRDLLDWFLACIHISKLRVLPHADTARFLHVRESKD